MLNPLHNIEFLTAQIVSTGTYPDASRCTGRSTAQALQLTAAAIRKPYHWVPIVDHHDTPMANEHLSDMCAGMINKLELKHFCFKRGYIAFGKPDR